MFVDFFDRPLVDKGGQWNEMAADCIVTPRALSAGRKSVTVEPSSTSVEFIRRQIWKETSVGMCNRSRC